MKKIMKTAGAVILALCLLLSALPVCAVSETEIVSLEIGDISVIENVDGYTVNYGDDEFCYYSGFNPPFVATMSDGGVYEASGCGFYYEGKNFWLDYYEETDQYDQHWTAGNSYPVNCFVNGKQMATFYVNVVENPIASITVDDMEIVTGTNGYLSHDFYGEDYYYYYCHPDYTVTMKDGTVYSLHNGENFVYNGRYCGLEIQENQWSEHWTVGNTYHISATLMDTTADFSVTITESPFLSLSIDDLRVNGINGYTETDKYDQEYYYYRYECPAYTVTLRDGTVLYSDGEWIEYDGEWYIIDIADNQRGQHWQVGQTYPVTGQIFGVSDTFYVTVEDSPYESIEILSVKPLIENTDCYDADGNVIYDIPEFSYRVVSKDGNDLYGEYPNDYKGYYTDSDYPVDVESDQWGHPWTPGGANEFTVSLYGLSTTGSAIIEPAEKFSYFEQAGGLFITDCRTVDETLEIPAQIGGKPVIGIDSIGHAAETVTELILPDSVRFLSENALHLNRLKTLTVGAGVSYLDFEMLCYCWNLETVEVAAGNPYYSDLDGVLYDKAGTTLIAYPFAHGDVYNVPRSVSNIDLLNMDCYTFLTVNIDKYSTAYRELDGVTYNADLTKILKCDPEKSGSYTMPDSVTEVADWAFTGCDKLTEVIFSDSVTELVYTFAGCSSLASVTLPEHLQKIGDRTFADCPIENISLPDSLTEIGVSAFEFCPLKSVDFPQGLTVIGDGAFNCTDLQSVTVPASVKSIGNHAFVSCRQLQSILLSEGLESIGSHAFAWTGLTEVDLPDSLTLMGDSAFYGSGLQQISFGKGLTEIPDNCFSNCDLHTLVLPAWVETVGKNAFSGNPIGELTFLNPAVVIGRGAFNGCPLPELTLPEQIKTVDSFSFSGISASSVEIPDSVTDIVYGAFSGSRNLLDISIPNSVTRIGGRVFEETAWADKNCTGNGNPVYLNHILYSGNGATSVAVRKGTTVIADYAFENEHGLTDVSLPDGLRTVGDFAFWECGKLTEINLPASVEQIGFCAFANCTSLRSVNVDPANPYFSSIDGVLFNKDGTELIWCPKREKTSYRVPETVTQIGSFAFQDSGIRTVEVTNGDVTLANFSIGYAARTVDFDHDVDTVHFLGTAVACQNGSTAEAYANENLLPVKNLCGVYLTKNTVNLIVGEYEKLTYTTLPGGLTPKWSTSDPSVAKVDGEGKIKPVSVGTATITASVTVNGETHTDTCKVTVVGRQELAGIMIASMPEKTEYLLGETADLTGLSLRLIYTDGTTETTDSGYTVSGFNLTTAGEKMGSVTFGGKTVYFCLTVKNKGDLTGDNLVDVKDLIRFKKAVLDSDLLTDAADVDSDGNINAYDLAAIRRFILTGKLF